MRHDALDACAADVATGAQLAMQTQTETTLPLPSALDDSENCVQGELNWQGEASQQQRRGEDATQFVSDKCK